MEFVIGMLVGAGAVVAWQRRAAIAAFFRSK